jgi:IclR family mhp operon transcriptional activator
LNAGTRYRVRALDRAIAILRVLNQHNGLNPSEMSRLVGLPRPTALRILFTLSEGGYVVRSETDGCFRSTLKVRELSCGYQEESWLGAIVRPFLERLETTMIWPLAVVRLRDTRLMVEALTDHTSHMLWRRETPGRAVSASVSATAHLYMALGDEEQRYALIDDAFSQDRDAYGWTEGDVAAAIERARANGYAIVHHADYTSVSVPVWVGEVLYCALNMRLHGPKEVHVALIDGHVQTLLDAADELAQEIASVIDPLPQPGDGLANHAAEVAR